MSRKDRKKEKVGKWKRPRKKHTNRHHLLPTSRFVKIVEKVLHNKWHLLFENDMPYEAVKDINEKWTTKEGKLSKKLSQKKQEAWRAVFGDADLQQAIKIIAKEWDIPLKDLISWFSYRLSLLKPEEQKRIIENLKK